MTCHLYGEIQILSLKATNWKLADEKDARISITDPGTLLFERAVELVSSHKSFTDPVEAVILLQWLFAAENEFVICIKASASERKLKSLQEKYKKVLVREIM